jgi:putative ABC transport system permease protein
MGLAMGLATSILILLLVLFGKRYDRFHADAREIGIRKAMGANPSGIVRLIMQEIPVLTGIAALIAWPPAWYFLRNWLNDFAYRIDLNAMPFLIDLAITLFIALLTTLYQTLRAALQNPADSLRYE